jgi:type II secretory pathway pseudopilin PulG
MTLIELLMVVTLIGILSTVVIARIGPGTIGRPGVQAETQRLAMSLRHARNLAITQGTNHYVGFDTTGYAVFRRDSPSDVVVEPHRTLPRGIDGTITAWQFEFEPTGAALAAYRCDLFGSGVTYRITVTVVTGLTSVRQL